MTMTEGTRRESSYRSRDLSSGTATALLDSPSRTARPSYHAPSRSRRRFQHAPGSQQVISYRGRRVERPKVDKGRVRFVAGILMLMIAGVAVTLVLSGLSTKQTFAIQQLQSQETTLKNQIETLNRDVENASSSAEIARKASAMGLVVPDAAGVLAHDDHGNPVVQREANDATHPLVDINGDKISPSASSDPAKTNEVAGSLNAVPQSGPAVSANTGTNTGANGSTVAPYAATAGR
ncbi:hypothetical protein [Corynebacterium ulcerans]|uniref:Cell division protein FtsL n=1 Tax=Corynebacterium ulcerans TaxID=65058 RepID=A0ABD0BHA2_CORUL|nr:hypothetical protein [Corynebacterium ulcerans]AIU92122.1 Hypothetical protein Cul05146_1560 [Corynebacterium ulcerans]MBL4943219.1 hypothetical protein [Corynebacterium ulcerans]QGZ25849.1 hypothetical protein CpMRi49_07745 [Corynebacterium ulcerans]QOE24538.1 hypothetical protein HUF05_08015 [Corynebacterium ulcerans]BBJ72478.1 hypothetical protein CULC0211_16120 [Corynebacterium ulcerans]